MEPCLRISIPLHVVVLAIRIVMAHSKSPPSPKPIQDRQTPTLFSQPHQNMHHGNANSQQRIIEYSFIFTELTNCMK